MASFRKRKGRWQVQVRRKGSPSVSRTFQSKADALVWARMMEAKIDADDLPTNHRELKAVTLADLIRRYRDEVTPAKSRRYVFGNQIFASGGHDQVL